MNPQERQVIDGIFERLKGVATQPRDPETERYIADLVRQQPYATYALAQSVYVSEQALLQQQQQIEHLQMQVQELQSRPQQSGGFLSGLFGGGSRPAPQPQQPMYDQRPQGMGMQQPGHGQPGMMPQQGMQPPQAGPWGQPQAQQPPRQGMGFLGTAAAAAAGVAGGMMLGSILSNAMGSGGAQAATPGAAPAAGPEQGPMPAEQGPMPEQAGWDNSGGFDAGGDSYDI
jgi:hypothetical protein